MQSKTIKKERFLEREKEIYLDESLSLYRLVANDLTQTIAAVCRRAWILLTNVL